MENSGLSAFDLSSLRKRLNADLSSAKRHLRWTWLRLPLTSRILARNVASNLQADLWGNKPEDEEGTDVTFVVGDRQFRARRRVLAAGSPVFEAELLGQMRETSAQHVKIDDVEPFIFEALLQYAATGALPDSVDGNAPLQHLLVAADRYGMHGLMALYERRLCQSIDVRTVATTLALAEQHRRVKLKDACIRFVSTKGVLGAIKETDGFSHLVESCPLVMVDILEQKLPSRVTRVMTELRTNVQRSLVMLGTMAASSFRHARGSEVCRDVGIVVAFFASCGIVIYISIKYEHSSQGRRSWVPRREALLQGLRVLQSCASGIAAQASWLSGLVSLDRLQEFQESAWVNSDI